MTRPASERVNGAVPRASTVEKGIRVHELRTQGVPDWVIYCLVTGKDQTLVKPESTRRQLNRWEKAAGLRTELDDRARQALAYAERRLGSAWRRLEKAWAHPGLSPILEEIALFPINNPDWEQALVTLGDDPACIRDLAAYERAIRAETELVKQSVATARAEKAANVLWSSVMVHRFEPDELGGALGDEPIYVPTRWSGLEARRFRLRRHRWRYTRMRAYLRELQSELRGGRESTRGGTGEKLLSDRGWSQENPNRAAIVRELRGKGVIPITEGSVHT